MKLDKDTQDFLLIFSGYFFFGALAILFWIYIGLMEAYKWLSSVM